MKCSYLYSVSTFALATLINGFQQAALLPSTTAALSQSKLLLATDTNSADDSVSSKVRKDLLSSIAAATLLSGFVQPAHARGFATLEQSYKRYGARIRSGGEFYATDLKSLVAKKDWTGIKNALAAPPGRQKADLNKPDAGVAARARQAGQFSDARVLVAADLFASAFSDASITGKTKKMQDCVVKMRTIVDSMESTAKQALGEETSGGLFGFGGKKVPEAELATKIRQLYVEGGNIWNEYILLANEELPGQFDKFDFVK